MASNIITEDIKDIMKVDFVPWNKLEGMTVFITGATGLIGTTLVRALDYANREMNLNLKIIALVRNMEKAQSRFQDIIENGMLQLLSGSVENLPEVQGNIDYIIHGASQTASKEFVEHAVETIETSVEGTFNLLKLARDKGVKGFVYLSSMEMYGYPEKGHKVTEEEIGALTPLDVRNSYPISKVMSEAMCCAYAREYAVPAKICRLTQTFGPGISENDNRIFAYFGRCVNERKNIVLKTRGETERCYLYTIDAATAILLILLNGESGTAYNAADEKTYCSISEMAERVAKDGGIEVEYDIQDESVNGFPRTLYMHLDTTRLKNLGWKSVV